MENKEVYEKAKKRVEEKLEFYIHLLVYIVVMAMLIYLNYSTSPQHLWFKWPLMGWGIGLFFHGVTTFYISEGSAIKEQMIENEMRKHPK